MRPIPRNYQSKAVEFGLDSLLNKKQTQRELIVSPTGSGKSVIVSELCHQLNAPTLILQPNEEILEQNYSKLLSYGIEDIGIYSAAFGKKDVARYTFASIGSVVKHPDLFKNHKYALIDEAHNVGPDPKSMYKKFFKELPKTKVLGLTASPWRLVQKYYTDPITEVLYYTSMIQCLTSVHPPFFKNLSFKINIGRLMEEGYLAPIDYIAPETFDFGRLAMNTTGADFVDAELEAFLMAPDKIQKIVTAVAQDDPYAPNNLIFCRSISQAHTCADLLSKMYGLNSEVIWGTDPLRDQKVKDFRSGKIKRLFNVKVLGIGFDFPGLYRVTLGTPTMSLGNLYQWVGRSLRTDPSNSGKRARVVDLCGNIQRMGRIETIKFSKDPKTNKDQIETELGVISGKPLFKYKVMDPEKIAKFAKFLKPNSTQ